MSCDIVNKTGKDMAQMTQIASDFFPYAQKRLGFDQPVTILLVSDEQNSLNPFGKTAHYDPNNMQIALYVDGRHPKDILRSLSHELVHHSQNCRGEFDGGMSTEQGYAQKDPHLRKMEAEAYLLGNGFLFRDYEDSLKENKKVSLKEKLRRSINKVLTERKNISELTERYLTGWDGPQPENVGRKIAAWDADSPYGDHNPEAQSRPGKLTFHPSDEGAPRSFATRKPTPLLPPSPEEQLFNAVTAGTIDPEKADEKRAEARARLSVTKKRMADKALDDPRPYGPPTQAPTDVADPERALRRKAGVQEQMNMEDLIREAVKEFIEEQTVELPDPPEGMDVADVKIPASGLGAGVDTTVDTDVETDLDTDTPAEMPDLPKPEDLPDVPGGATMEEGELEEYRGPGRGKRAAADPITGRPALSRMGMGFASSYGEAGPDMDAVDHAQRGIDYNVFDKKGLAPPSLSPEDLAIAMSGHPGYEQPRDEQGKVIRSRDDKYARRSSREPKAGGQTIDPRGYQSVDPDMDLQEEYRVDGKVRPVHTKNYVQDQNIDARYLDKVNTGQRVPKQWEDAAETMTTDRVGAVSMGQEDAQVRRADDFSKYDSKGGAVREEERPRFGRPGHEDWSPDPSAAAMGSQNQVNVAETKETLKEWKNRTLNEMLMSKFIKKESK